MIREAIAGHRLLAFTYLGRQRICEPHVLGLKHGKEQLLAYQVEGTSSSGDIPDWRRFDAAHMERPRMLNRTFDGPRDWGSGQRSDFDVVLETVQ
jgi:hypothetical protein